MDGCFLPVGDIYSSRKEETIEWNPAFADQSNAVSGSAGVLLCGSTSSLVSAGENFFSRPTFERGLTLVRRHSQHLTTCNKENDMSNRSVGSWLGPALGIIGTVAGLSASSAVHGGAFAGLLVGSLCAVWGIAFWRPSRRAT